MNAGRQLTVTITTGIGLVAIVLGYLGYRDVDPEPSRAETLYQAIQLLALEYNGPPSPPPLLEISRYLGALAIGLAVLLVLGAVARDRVNNLMIRWFKKDHVVIVGLGDRGSSIAHALGRSGRTIVGLDLDPEGRVRAEDGGNQIAFVEVDATNKAAYRNAAASKADHIFMTLGDDSLNVQAFEVGVGYIDEILGDRENQPTLHVVLEDQELWRVLHRTSLTWSGGGGAIEFIYMPDRVGLAMVEGVSLELEQGSDPETSRVVLWGSGSKAIRTGVHAVRSVLVGEREPELVLAGPHAGDLRRELLASEPWIEPWLADQPLSESETSGFRYAFVVGLDHPNALEGATVLCSQLPGTRVIVEVPRASGRTALARSGFPVEHVELIDAEHRVLGSGVLEISARELLARANHDDYVAKELAERERAIAAGEEVKENTSLVPWSEGDEWLHESNRAFADAIGERLADLDAELVPLTGLPKKESELFTEERVHELAPVEHERWMQEKLDAGWTYGPGEKDPVRKTHPSLIPFKQLSEDEQRKDRDRIKSLPKLLSKMGYEIRPRPERNRASGE